MPLASTFNDKYAQQLNISIEKAIKPAQIPVKEKHVRSAIIGTYQEKSGARFWWVMLDQPVKENRIVAWKFCHVLHKVLREGHPMVISDSHQYRGKLKDLGLLWQHLQEVYGRLIFLYTRLLMNKLDFHKRNARFPGNLIITNEKLEEIGENDINVYFQLCVEMFDYMDDILALQEAVLESLDMCRTNSMTPSGQCRLAPFIPCALDAAQLYDYCVKIMFKLHGALPADTLSGHRERFTKQFRELKKFYGIINCMQYFRQLITIPSLPKNPPNFLVQSEFGTYVTPVVVLPEEKQTDNEYVIDSLIDTSDTTSIADKTDSGTNGSISPDSVQRDNLIEQLHRENVRHRQKFHGLLAEHQAVVLEHGNRLAELESKIAEQNAQILRDSERIKEIEEKKDNAELINTENNVKYKFLEEKYQKVTAVYSQLRDEHVSLIRKKAEVDKQLGILQSEHEQTSKKVQDRSAEEKLSILLQQLASAQADLQVRSAEFDEQQIQNTYLNSKFETVKAEKEALESQLRNITDSNKDLDLQLTLQKEQAHIELDRVKTKSDNNLQAIFENCLSEAELIVTNAIHIIDDPSGSSLTCTPDYLDTLLKPTDHALTNLCDAYNRYLKDSIEKGQLECTAMHVSHTFAVYLILARSTANTSKDITFGDKLTHESKQLGYKFLTMLKHMKSKENSVSDYRDEVKKQLDLVSSLAATLLSSQGNAEAIESLLEKELSTMDKAIEEAAGRIQEMLDKSRSADSGVKLEVNGKILDSCTELMWRIRNLVKKSRALQKEILDQGRGTASATEFYKRNHQWSEGLISAAKAIAMGANFLLEAADQVVTRGGKFEQLVAASQGIAASTAQLVVASRVKADRNSSNLALLSEASKSVTEATGNVVATVKNCSKLVEDKDDLELSGLSLHQAKRLEMEAQVRVLELEQALETGRFKLAALRRYHYQMAGENEK